MRFALSCFGLFPLALSAFVSDYIFVDNPHVDMSTRPYHYEGLYRITGKAKFEEPKSVKGSKLDYHDANASIFYNHHFNKQHALSGRLGLHQINIDWKENPRFKGKDYNFAHASVAYISNAIDKWRWVVHSGAFVDQKSFDFHKTGIGYGLVWGRYQVNRALRIHTGAFGYYGLRRGLLLPVIGFDTYLSRKLKVDLYVPLNASIRYMINYNWFIVLAGSYFGEFQRMPMRIKDGIGPFKDGIFHVKAKGFDINLIYNFKCRFTALLGVGSHFGGSMLIKDSKNRNGTYFKFGGAPYVQMRIHGSF